MLRDKCIALLKGLPKSIRRNFVPASSYVDKFLEVAKPSDIKLTKALGLSLQSQTGIDISSDDWSRIKLDDIFHINFELIDKKSHILAVSKNIEELKLRFKIKISNTLAQVATHSIEQEDIKDWSFGDLPEIYTIVNENLTIKTYPALIVEDAKISLKLTDNSLFAINKTLLGLNALYQLIDSKSVKYLKKNLLSGMDLQLKFAGLESKELLTKQIIDKAYFLSFLENEKIPRNKSDFEFRFIEGKSKVISTANELDDIVTTWTPLISDIRREISKYKQSYADSIQDIDRQLSILFCDGFLFQVPIKLLRQYHRYLQSILIRLEKLRQNAMKEQAQVAEITNLEARLKEKNQQIEKLSLVAVSELWEHSFLLQEYRVSLFSQGLKTIVPVSKKRIDLHWEKIQNLI
jgi:ATP-dependent helicase HrpA